MRCCPVYSQREQIKSNMEKFSFLKSERGQLHWALYILMPRNPCRALRPDSKVKVRLPHWKRWEELIDKGKGKFVFAKLSYKKWKAEERLGGKKKLAENFSDDVVLLHRKFPKSRLIRNHIENFINLFSLIKLIQLKKRKHWVHDI